MSFRGGDRLADQALKMVEKPDGSSHLRDARWIQHCTDEITGNREWEVAAQPCKGRARRPARADQHRMRLELNRKVAFLGLKVEGPRHSTMLHQLKRALRRHNEVGRRRQSLILQLVSYLQLQNVWPRSQALKRQFLLYSHQERR